MAKRHLGSEVMVRASVEAGLHPWLRGGGRARGAAALPPGASAIAGSAESGRRGAASAVGAAGRAAEVLAAELAGEGALAGGHADGAGRRQEQRRRWGCTATAVEPPSPRPPKSSRCWSARFASSPR